MLSKTRLKLILSSFSMGTLLLAQAQKCGYDHALEVREQQYPGYKTLVDETFNTAQLKSNELLMNKSTDALLEIPVVVHILYKTNGQNVSETRVNNVIASLNRDYQRQNADSVNLRSEFHPLAGNAGVKFNLVHVERVATTQAFDVTFFGMPDDKIKNSNNGGSTAWNTQRYLNIWVCDIDGSALGGELLGYAYPPAYLANWPAGQQAPDPAYEGVVIDFTAFNTSGSIGVPVRGRTVTHEVGHYLGLRHIWGDASCGNDGIDDTPQATQSVSNCNKTRNSCVDTYLGTDWPDMVENFMDYSLETCQNTFTKGQVNHMRAVLADQRVGLLNPLTYSVQDTKEQNSLVLAPNPASESINVRFLNTDAEPVTLIIQDLMGRTVHSLQTQSTFISEFIPIHNLDNGVYTLNLKIGSNVLSKKFVVLK